MSEKLGYSAKELWGEIPREAQSFLGQLLPHTYHVFAEYLNCCAEDLPTDVPVGRADGLKIPHPKLGIVDADDRDVFWNGTGLEDKSRRKAGSNGAGR